MMKCPICFSDQTKNVNKTTAGAQESVLKCHNCWHIFLSGSTKTAASRESYQSTFTTETIKYLDKEALKRLDYYKPYLSEWDNFLEIGSELGSFVHLLKLWGKEAYGLESDPHKATFSPQHYGFKQYLLAMDESLELPGRFQVICSFGLLQHLKDPHSILSLCKNHLLSNGRILFEFPTYETIPESSRFRDGSMGIHYFSQSSAYQLFTGYFQVISIGYYGDAMFIVADSQTGKNDTKQAKGKFKFRSKLNSILAVPLQSKGNDLGRLQSGKRALREILLQKQKFKSLKRILGLGQFAIRNRGYERKERGQGSHHATHFSYYSGWENAGDTVLSKTVRDNFNVIRPTRWALKKVTDPVTDETIQFINGKSYLVVGGGGLLLPDSNPNSISGWQWAISKTQLNNIEVPLMIYAIGYNYFPGQKPDQFFIDNLKQVIDKSSFFSLRNYGSIRSVLDLVGESYNSKIRYQPCTTTVIRLVDKNAPTKRKTRNVGVNIAYDRYHRRYGPKIYEILSQTAKALKQLNERGYTIYNLCHLENDKKFELTLDALDVPYQSVNLQFSLPRDTYETYSNMELVMGTRGHAQMIPFGLNTKIISLGSHNKLRWFLEDIDAMEWFVDMREEPSTLSTRLTELFFQLIESREVDQKIEFHQQRLYDITRENYQVIEEVLPD